MSPITRRVSLLLAPALMLAAGCAINPATGKRQLSLISESQEIRMGADADGDVSQQMGLYEDEDLEQVVQDTGQQLAALSERPGLPWSFKIVDDPAVNAFALPGGYIYLTRGILAHFNSTAEMAGVLGHEIGHVTARHSVNQMSKAQLAGLGLGLGAALDPSVARYANLTSAGVGILFLKFGRDDERQADDLGFRYLGHAGYPQEAMVDVFEMLQAAGGGDGSSRAPGWLSTHPSPENREERIRALMGDNPAPPAVPDTRWLHGLEGLVYGEDPRQGFFRESLFVHPEMAFRIRFPDDWTAVNQRSFVAARHPEGDALIKLSLVPADTIAAAAEQFFALEGVRRGQAWRTTVNGLPVASGTFSVGEPADGSAVAGLVVFVGLDQQVLRLVGYAPADIWPGRQVAVETSLASFQRLTATADLKVQPRRLVLTRVQQPTTLAAFHRAHPSSVSLEEIARLNRLRGESRLSAGTLVKRVVGGPE
jgi:predicted Zn-dependent protease